MARVVPIFTFLEESGGSRNANVDGSITPVDFEYVAPAGIFVELERIIIYIQDTGNFDVAGYGALAALTNGITAEIDDGAAVFKILSTDVFTVKTNADWASLCYDLSYLSFGVGDNAAAVRWTFGKAGAPLTLEPGHIFRVSINDDLTGLTAHRFQIQGTTENNAGLPSFE